MREILEGSCERVGLWCPQGGMYCSELTRTTQQRMVAMLNFGGASDI